MKFKKGQVVRALTYYNNQPTGTYSDYLITSNKKRKAIGSCLHTTDIRPSNTCSVGATYTVYRAISAYVIADSLKEYEQLMKDTEIKTKVVEKEVIKEKKVYVECFNESLLDKFYNWYIEKYKDVETEVL